MRRARISGVDAGVGLALLTTLALPGGCGGTGGGAAEGGHPSSGPAWLTAEVKPTNLRLTLDTTAAMSVDVDPRGGTLSASAEDGTFYTLTIPPGSLIGSERITMTPVRRADGIPARDSSIALVQLEPEGLRLERPATLTIDRPTPANRADLVTLAYVGHGSDAHLYPAFAEDGRVTMRIAHFSGYGMAGDRADGSTRALLENASSIEGRLEARLSAAVDEAVRKAGPDATMGDVWPAIAPIMTEYYRSVVEPLLKAATTDDRLARCAMQQYFAWAYKLETLGPGEQDAEPARQLAAEGHALVSEVLRNAAEHAYDTAMERCRQHDLLAAPWLTGAVRQAVLLGALREEQVPDMLELQKFMESCYRFEVDLSSVIENDMPSGSAHYAVQSSAKWVGALRRSDARSETAPLRFTNFTMKLRPKEDVFGKWQLGASHDMNEVMANFIELGNAVLTDAGHAPGSLRVVDIRWETQKRDTVGTTCAGVDGTTNDELQNDTLSLVLRIEPPTEVVRVTPVHRNTVQPFTSDMHEWMRFFQQRRGDSAEIPPDVNRDEDVGDGGQPRLVTVRAIRERPGIWRAKLETPEESALPGWTFRERGSLVVTHTPAAR